MKMAKRKRPSYKDHDEQSDEDYKVSENELFDCSEDESFSLVCDTSGESLGDFEEDDELEELKNKKQKKVVRKNDVIPKASGRQKHVVNRRKRKRVMSRADDYSSDDEDFIPFEINKVVKPEIRKRVVYSDDDDDDDDDNGDDDNYDDSDDDDYVDDKDFTLDEIDCADDEDEDEFPTTRGRKRLGKPQLPKGNNNRVQRRRISKVSNKARKQTSKSSKKSTRKSPRKNIVQKVRKNYAQERSKQRLIVDSDSDFVSCASSDPEYTISEEERDQDSAANKICRDLMVKSRSPPSSKNLPGGKNRQPQKKRSLRKGKEKVVTEEIKKSEEVKRVCGICLTEEGKKTIRGTLNCCSHFFCFACIMEWSKVESRCPLCKQRFLTITKAATKSSAGFNSRTAVIQVPERDQVYVPSEEELRDYLDVYANILCTECQQGGDDAHMLLCDICDSPAHTYCVGLGYLVPEGDWYCESCRLTSPRYTNPGSSNPTVNHFNFRLPSMGPSSRRESLDSDEMYVPETPLTQRTCNSSSPRDAQASSSSSASRFAAFTVSDRRRIHHGINRLINIRWRR